MGGAHQKLMIVVMVVLVAIASNGGFFQVANAQSSICNVPINSLMNCKAAVTAPNPAPPTTSCCAALKHANFVCLCSYKNSSVLPALGIDPNLALQLPAKCNLPHPANC